MIPVTLFLIVATGLMLLLRGGRRNPERRAGPERRKATQSAGLENPHRAVSICAPASACAAALARSDARILLSDAPQLPLPSCDAGRCDCRYQHHQDRRAGDDDRRVPGRLRSQLYVESGRQERRNSNRGRRLADRVGA